MHARSRSPDATAPRSNTALRILATIGVGAVLYFARAAIAPVALAVLFSLLLTTPVELLNRRGVPRSAAALAILAEIVAVRHGRDGGRLTSAEGSIHEVRA